MDYPQHKALTISIEAGSDLTSVKRFVKMSSGKLSYCGANGKAIGVLDKVADTGEYASVIAYGIALVEVGTGGVTENAEVTSDANGKAVLVGSLSATASGTAVSSTASGTAVSIPEGSTPVTSTGAQPTLSVTDPTISNTVTQPTVTLTGGALPVKVNGIALDTVSAGGFARILLK